MTWEHCVLPESWAWMHVLDLALPQKIPQSCKWRGLVFGNHSPLFQLLGDFLPRRASLCRCSSTQSAFIAQADELRALYLIFSPTSPSCLLASWKGRKKSLNLGWVLILISALRLAQVSINTLCCLNAQVDFKKSLGITFLLISYQNLSFEINSSEVSQVVILLFLLDWRTGNTICIFLKLGYLIEASFLFPLAPITFLMWDGKRTMVLAVGDKKHWLKKKEKKKHWLFFIKVDIFL